MKYKYGLTSAFVAASVLTSFQIPSNASVTKSFSMATGMTKAQITKVGDAINQSFAKALATAKPTTTVSNLSISVTLSANGRYKCSTGGYINTTYTMRSITIKNTGNVTMSGYGHQTLSDWRCVTGWIINGDPYISHTLTGSVFAGKTTMRGTMSGGWKATGPSKAKQSCQLSGSTQYAATGNSGVTSIRVTCVPGGTTSFTERF